MAARSPDVPAIATIPDRRARAHQEAGVAPDFRMVRGARSSHQGCTMLRLPMNGGKARRRGLRPGLEGLEDRVTPTTFHVNTFLDTVAVNLKTGKDASGHISLRSAIMAADAHGRLNKIILPAGTFTLTIAPAGDDDNSTGDLDISANVSIQGRARPDDHRRQQPRSGHRRSAAATCRSRA